MKRRIFAISVCVLLIIFLTGCQLAQINADGAVAEDRLVGIFLSTEHLDLFDFDSCMKDNLKDFLGSSIIEDGDMQTYQGRMYATLTTQTFIDEETGEKVETEEYIFPVPGIPFFWVSVPAIENRESYLTTISDPAISDAQKAYSSSDEGDSVTLSGTLYVTPSNLAHMYYFNPVYQGAGGEVYALSGEGFMFNTDGHDEGPVYSQTMEATASVTENGKLKADRSSVTLSISLMFSPENIVVLQMDEGSNILSKIEYAPDDLPDSISKESQTAYLIVETHKRDGGGQQKISRTIYASDAEGFESFFVREGGVCEGHWTQIKR